MAGPYTVRGAGTFVFPLAELRIKPRDRGLLGKPSTTEVTFPEGRDICDHHIQPQFPHCLKIECHLHRDMVTALIRVLLRLIQGYIFLAKRVESTSGLGGD